MIRKFEATGDLGVRSGKGRKRILNETEKEVALAAVETEFRSQNSASSAGVIARDSSLPWFTVRKILCSISSF